jgi:CO/xanthine dehydrogenase FAD-binding subunit
VRTALSSLSLVRPRTLKQALNMMRDEALTPLAGCTDVYVNLQFGTAPDVRYIDVWPLADLRGIGTDGGQLRIGALTTYTDIITSRLVQRRLPMLVAAAREIGGKQIQNRGTLGGNIANASPAGDSLPVLAAVDATVVLVNADGERRVPLMSYYTGYRTSIRRPDELIAAVEIPRVEGRQWWRKVGTRRAQAISKVMMAAVRAPLVRVAVGSVAPTVVRLRHTEDALSALTPIGDAQRILADEIAPIDDVRSTAGYRSRVCANLLAQFWEETSSV